MLTLLITDIIVFRLLLQWTQRTIRNLGRRRRGMNNEGVKPARLVNRGICVDKTAKSELAAILRFYLPLATTSILMMVTHSLVSGAMARTLSPAITLAAYSAAYAVGQVLESPCYALQKMVLTFTRGKRSYRTAAIVAAEFLAVVASIYILLAWSPLSTVVFRDLLGLSEAVLGRATVDLKVLLLWPIASALRSIFQSKVVIGKRTYWLTINMVLRVALMFMIAAVLPRVMPEGPVGSVILMAGLCLEALLAFVVSQRFTPPLEEDDADLPEVRPSQVVAFMLPLVLAASVQTVAKPVVTAALSRTANPETTLAGYQVASSFSYIFAAATYNIYHVMVVFVKDRPSFRRVRNFVLAIGVIASSLLLIAALPGPGAIIFGKVIGAPQDITQEAVRTLIVLAVTPLLLACAEFFDGILMLHKHSGLVTAAKMCNVGVTCVTAMVVARLWPQTGGIAGALAIGGGVLVEVLFSYRYTRILPDTAEYLKRDLAHAGVHETL